MHKILSTLILSVRSMLLKNGYSESEKIFSREEMAQIAGTATESLIRVLHEK